MVPVEREETYLEEELITTTKLAHEMQEAPGPTVFLSILSLGIYAAVTHMVVQTTTVLVKKTRTVTTEEMQYERGVHTVIKRVEVEDARKPLEYFFEQARQDIAAEIRESCRTDVEDG